MSALKFLTVVSGIKKIVSAITSSAGITDANKILATDATGKLSASFLPPGIDLSVETIIASEDLAAGDYVNIWDDAGDRSVRKADAATAKSAHGYVLAAVTTGDDATVYITGLNDQLSGFTPGAKLYLSATTPGTATATPPAETSGYINQVLGVAASATSSRFEFDDPIEFA